LEWIDPETLNVRVEGVLNWTTRFRSTPSTRVMSAAAARVPDRLWASPAFLEAMGRVSGPALHAGAIRLAGRVPSGKSFQMDVSHVWATADVAAMMQGGSLGPIGRVRPQRWLGGFAMPNRGLFAAGRITMELFRPDLHQQMLSGVPPAIARV
jgi:hypothetical protein